MKKSEKSPRRRAPAPVPLRLALACAWLAGAWPVAAQTLGEVMVSASRHEQPVDELPVSADVIGAGRMEREQMGDIHDVARDLPNVSVRHAPSRFAVTGAANPTGRDANAGFSIRGLGGNRVLLMEDGIRLPRAYSFGGNAFGRDYLALDMLQRIEIVRGPASALYGSDGMAGLVNLITREPRDLLASPGGGPARALGGRAALTYNGADKGTTLSAALAGQPREELAWVLSASGRHAQGLQTRGSVDTPDLNRTTANPQRDRDSAILAKIDWTPGAGQRHVFTAEDVHKSSEVNLLSSRAVLPLSGSASVIAGAILNETGDNRSHRQRLSWHGRWQPAGAMADQVQTLLAWQRAGAVQTGFSDRNTLPDRWRTAWYAENQLQAGVQLGKRWAVSPTWGHQLTYGIDWLRASVDTLSDGANPLPPESFPLKRFPATRESSQALYAQSEWFSDRLTLTPGLRLDRFDLAVRSQDGFYPPAKLPARSLSGSAVSPRLGAVWTASPQWRLYANLGAGFRAPNAGQVNLYYENTGENVVIVPNPDLKPERSRSLEVGARWRGERAHLDLAVFTARYRDLILDNQLIGGTGTAADPKVFQTLNAERASIHGAELRGAVHWGAVAGGALLTPFQIGWARGRNGVTGRPLNGIDPLKIALGLEFRGSLGSVRLDARHHGAKRAADIDSAAAVKAPNTQLTVPAFTTLDLMAQWRLAPRVRLNAAIMNLTNRKYWLWPDVIGLAANTPVADAYTQPGRHLRVSLVADF